MPGEVPLLAPYIHGQPPALGDGTEDEFVGVIAILARRPEPTQPLVLGTLYDHFGARVVAVEAQRVHIRGGRQIERAEARDITG
jgi:hypothetical protein